MDGMIQNLIMLNMVLFGSPLLFILCWFGVVLSFLPFTRLSLKPSSGYFFFFFSFVLLVSIFFFYFLHFMTILRHGRAGEGE